jgi:hypothetical protein
MHVRARIDARGILLLGVAWGLAGFADTALQSLVGEIQGRSGLSINLNGVSALLGGAAFGLIGGYGMTRIAKLPAGGLRAIGVLLFGWVVAELVATGLIMQGLLQTGEYDAPLAGAAGGAIGGYALTRWLRARLAPPQSQD